jgi:hypothetical protein
MLEAIVKSASYHYLLIMPPSPASATPSRQSKPYKARSNSVPYLVDKQLVEIVNSPQVHLAFVHLKTAHSALFELSTVQESRQVKNRYIYLKQLSENYPTRFLKLTNFYKSTAYSTTPPSTPEERPTPSTPEERPTPSTPEERPTPASSARRLIYPQSPPPSAAMSRQHRSSVLPGMPDDEEIVLNIGNPERNNSMLVLRTDDVMLSKVEQIDQITIMKPLCDPRDIKHIKAVLDPDGRSIILIEPVVPTFMLKEVKAMHAMDDFGGKEHCVLTKRSHQIAATNVQTNELRATKRTLLHFPDGIVCKTVDKKAKLKNNFRMMQIDAGEKGQQNLHPIQWVFWKLTIDSESRLLERQDSDDSDDLTDAMKRMSAMKVAP